MNHSCWPNADVQNSEPTKGMVIRAVRDIEPGERDFDIVYRYLRFT